MARIEKTVFISYRRSDVYTALAVYENLKNQGYDVFFDYRSISSGDFEQIITSNIRARAHFLLILTPTALDRLNEPGDWLRREIEIAIEEKRNIVPVFFRGFRFGTPSASESLTGKLRNLSRYNGLNVHEDYFDEAMHRLRTQYLNIPLDTILHPVSTEVQKVVKEEQVAADEALRQIDDVQELVKIAEEKPAREREAPQPVVLQVAAGDAGKRPRAAPQKPSAGKTPSLLPDRKSLTSRFNLRMLLGIGALLVVVSLGIAVFPALKNMIAPGIGSTMTGKDDMTLLYVPAGSFTMGSNDGSLEEQPVHIVDLDAFWIDQTEVTNAMYARCVADGVCEEPADKKSWTRSSYYGDPEFDNYPVISVDWTMAKTYCEWAGRRLPTEAEWEKAARGENANMYPWGNESPNNGLLNYNSVIGDTTEVGKYPDGASVYGALDMAGNVWEWVSSLKQPYPYDAADGRENLDASDAARVLRGGTWRDGDGYARSASRFGDSPTSTFNYAGFRCAVSEDEQVGSTPVAQVETKTPQVIATDTPSPTESTISATPTLGIGSTITSEKDGMTLVYVPAGEFTMGGYYEPAHQVYIDAFWIDRIEVTNALYAKCVNAGVCKKPSQKNTNFGNSQYDNYPVNYVFWGRAETYCNWAGRRLPTEAEWEKAARGIDERIYPWGNEPPNDTLFNSTELTKVGSYPNGISPNGALDMAGNVYEWVADWYSPTYYINSEFTNPLGPSSGKERIIKGGTWYYVVEASRSDSRRSADPYLIEDGIGFRCAMNATP